MISIYKENDKSFTFARKRVNGEIIKTVPQGLYCTVKDDIGSVKISKSLNNGIEQSDDGTWAIMIDSSDTSNIAVGVYRCDVKVKDEIGREFTIVTPQDFKVLDVVTGKENMR